MDRHDEEEEEEERGAWKGWWSSISSAREEGSEQAGNRDMTEPGIERDDGFGWLSGNLVGRVACFFRRTFLRFVPLLTDTSAVGTQVTACFLFLCILVLSIPRVFATLAVPSV